MTPVAKAFPTLSSVTTGRFPVTDWVEGSDTRANMAQTARAKRGIGPDLATGWWEIARVARQNVPNALVAGGGPLWQYATRGSHDLAGSRSPSPVVRGPGGACRGAAAQGCAGHRQRRLPARAGVAQSAERRARGGRGVPQAWLRGDAGGRCRSATDAGGAAELRPTARRGRRSGRCIRLFRIRPQRRQGQLSGAG